MTGEGTPPYAVPVAWREQWGIRRHGFPGSVTAWASRRASELVGRLEKSSDWSPPTSVRRLAAAWHLALGRHHHGVHPMEGLVMSTRSAARPRSSCGLQQRKGWSAAMSEEILERESGLLGLRQIREISVHVIDAADAGDSKAALLRVYVYRINSVAPCGAAMEGIDGLCSQAEQARHPPAAKPTHARVFRSSA